MQKDFNKKIFFILDKKKKQASYQIPSTPALTQGKIEKQEFEVFFIKPIIKP